MITFANVEIPRSPFEVNIGKHKTSKIKAYGPGLKGGIINKPAKFTVDTCGETGALGFSIQGPSQAKINCKVGPILYHFFSSFFYFARGEYNVEDLKLSRPCHKSCKTQPEGKKLSFIFQ